MSKALIVLQENTGRIDLPEGISTSLSEIIYSIIDGLAETFEDVKTNLQAANRYDVVHLLTDNLCSRKKLLETLVLETKRKRTIDLIVLGHGSVEKLIMKKKPDLSGGPSGNIRSLLRSARKSKIKKFNLRMVFMCNCYGSSLNDDWLAIGARAAIGSKYRNYMPEPMITFFLHNWLSGQHAKNAAKNAYQATIPFYAVAYPPTTRIKHKMIKVSYPCPTFTDLLKICSRDIRVPNGVDLITNTKITESKLIVGGQGNTTF